MNARTTLTTLMLLLVVTATQATTWTDMAQLTASNAFDDDRFGWSVAVQSNTVVVGAPRTDGVNVQEGSVYVYDLDQATGSLTETAQLVWSTPGRSDFLGISVAIDGDVIVAGAHQVGSGGGRALVFVKPDSGWVGTIEEEAVLWASNRGSGDEFGVGVAVDGPTIAVGAWGEDTQGGSAGAVYVYTRPDSGWAGVLQEDAMLIPSTGTNTWMGIRVDVENDVVVTGGAGTTVGGNSYQGMGFVYVKPDSGWSGTMTETAALVASDGRGSDRFGRSVAISEGIIACGSYQDEPPGLNSNHGSIYLFKEPNTGWSGTVNEIAQLRISDPSNSSKFGFSLAMEGPTVVGASLTKEAVYVFERPATGWSGIATETQKIANPSGNDDDFGQGLALAAGYLVVAAPYDDAATTNAGRAYVYSPALAAVAGPTPVASRLGLRAAPNPFNPRVAISFALDREQWARVAVYDVRGSLVKVLQDGVLLAGDRTVTWDGTGAGGARMASGVYLVDLQVGSARERRAVTLVK